MEAQLENPGRQESAWTSDQYHKFLLMQCDKEDASY